MSTITIFYGTETGNAEMVADDIADALAAGGIESASLSLEEADVTDLATSSLAVIVTSTYGEGELPATTEPFHTALLEANPDLSSLRFAAFGLGDSSYATYNNAVQTFSSTLENLGATKVAAIGRHDAISGVSASEASHAWTTEVLLAAIADPTLTCPFGHTS